MSATVCSCVELTNCYGCELAVLGCADAALTVGGVVLLIGSEKPCDRLSCVSDLPDLMDSVELLVSGEKGHSFHGNTL